jgi:hypothetical protein
MGGCGEQEVGCRGGRGSLEGPDGDEPADEDEHARRGVPEEVDRNREGAVRENAPEEERGRNAADKRERGEQAGDRDGGQPSPVTDGRPPPSPEFGPGDERCPPSVGSDRRRAVAHRPPS